MQILQNIFRDIYIYYTHLFTQIINLKIIFQDLLCFFSWKFINVLKLWPSRRLLDYIFLLLMAASTNHHFPAATLVVCGQPYPALGTKGSWDTCSGTPGPVWFSGTAVGLGQAAGRSWPQCPASRVVPGGPGAPVATRGCGGVRVQWWPGAGHRPGLCLPVQGHGLQEAPPTHIPDLWILVALNYTFVRVITSHAGRLKLPRVILGQATITIFSVVETWPLTVWLQLALDQGL